MADVLVFGGTVLAIIILIIILAAIVYIIYRKCGQDEGQDDVDGYRNEIKLWKVC